ncbi:MAG: NADH-quinone oxidoreductase subunit C [Desulfurococcaceae archaeon]
MDASEKISLIESFAIEEGTVKPSRRLYVVKPEDVRKLFLELINRYGYGGFYVSTLVGTDLPSENKIRLDYYVVLLPEEVTVVIRTFLGRENPVIDSLIDIIPGLLAGERETHDLLGVVFNGNPLLKRGFFVATDVAEQGKYPLRKDSGV